MRKTYLLELSKSDLELIHLLTTRERSKEFLQYQKAKTEFTKNFHLKLNNKLYEINKRITKIKVE